MFKFPYDTQICHLEFGNVVESDMTVNISVASDIGFFMDLYSPSNEFILTSTHARRTTWQVGSAVHLLTCFMLTSLSVCYIYTKYINNQAIEYVYGQYSSFSTLDEATWPSFDDNVHHIPKNVF